MSSEHDRCSFPEPAPEGPGVLRPSDRKADRDAWHGSSFAGVPSPRLAGALTHRHGPASVVTVNTMIATDCRDNASRARRGGGQHARQALLLPDSCH